MVTVQASQWLAFSRPRAPRAARRWTAVVDTLAPPRGRGAESPAPMLRCAILTLRGDHRSAGPDGAVAGGATPGVGGAE